MPSASGNVNPEGPISLKGRRIMRKIEQEFPSHDTEQGQSQRPKRYPVENPESIDGFVPVYQSFAPHSAEDHNDLWFAIRFEALYEEIVSLVTVLFCQEHLIVLRGTPRSTPWSVKMPSALLSYAEAIAEPDRHSGGWDNLLRNKDLRKWLLVGIFAKLLQVQIFDQPLFGSDDDQRDILDLMDITLAGNEGTRYQLMQICLL